MSRSAWPGSVNHRHDESGSRFRATTRPTREDGNVQTVADSVRREESCRFIWSLLGRCRKAECEEHSADGFLVVMAEGPYPIPSRTRKSSPPAPMVLQGPPCGRVGHRQIYGADTGRCPPHTFLTAGGRREGFLRRGGLRQGRRTLGGRVWGRQLGDGTDGVRAMKSFGLRSAPDACAVHGGRRW